MTGLARSPTRSHRVATLDLRLEPWEWPFARARRPDIASYFAGLREARPQLWNGRVLLARDVQITGDTLSARYFETDFASFLAWRDWGFPDRAVFNGFGMGALCGSDGGFVLGEMAKHTANAGKVYFPSGTPDPSDVRGTIVDIAASVAREVEEETGLSPDHVRASADWTCIVCGQLVAMICRLDADTTSDQLQTQIQRFIAGQREPELSAVHIAKCSGDISPAMPDFIAAYLAEQFGGDETGGLRS